MQKFTGCLVALVALMLMGAIVTAGETPNISVIVAGKHYDKNLGDYVALSGVNIATTDAYPITYITLEKVGYGIIQNYQVQSDNHAWWSYKIYSLDLGTYRVTVRRSPDSTEFAQDEFRIVVPTPIPTPTPTPSPTPNYEEKITKLEEKLAAQETKINAQETKIKQIDEKTPIPTAIPTTIITTKTPIPTPTIDHAAIEAALEKRLAEVEAEQKDQGGWIQQIMRFLGLG